jgi:hypothetical protein
MNKIEVWNKYELFDLFIDLDTAQRILAEIRDGHSGNFLSAEDFCKAFEEELNELKHDNVPDFRQICLWFTPTSAWDNFVGYKGMDLANRILDRANRWNTAHL